MFRLSIASTSDDRWSPSADGYARIGQERFEGHSGAEHSNHQRRRIVLPKNLCKTNEIKADIKNGVLKLLIQKLRGEE
ncbi:Hypothetical predicted protein [Olea europaea subsp. europaea]|uniref:SHSP domain-containing protein n=1 Tax=Olea europaea subsp. europaea TaxID=158383 RepID=A0A8S0QBM8_OLEEU|nr:Hypothetical predicted protein [Olea europaea subsp. europaea]